MKVPKIPNFRSPDFQSLINKLIKGTCIFLGAGVSKLAGYKLWSEICESMVLLFWESRSKLEKKSIDFNNSTKEILLSMKDRNPKEVLDYLYVKDKKLFEHSIEKMFKEDEKKEETKVYEELAKIVRLGKNYFVLTNIDTSFQRYYGIQDSDVSINPYFSGGLKELNYLHGRLDKKETWVFTTKQYNLNYLDENSRTFKFLVGLFKNHDVLFIGYSLRDHEIQQAIAKSRLLDNNKIHYLLVEYDELKKKDLEIKEDSFRDIYGTHFIRYNIENDGPSLLLDVIRELNIAVKARLEKELEV